MSNAGSFTYIDISRSVGRLAGVACTKSHLLLLGDDQSHQPIDSSNSTDDESHNGDDANKPSKQLKLLLRVKKFYNTAVVTSGFTLLICARGGTLDLFKVGHHCKKAIQLSPRL